jgi:DNA helicase-2/ATP-dependent DNA helicase PcrA
MRALYLTYARRRAVFGAQTNGMRSRFLDEIPVELLEEPREPARWGVGRDAGGLYNGATAATAAPLAGPAPGGWAASSAQLVAAEAFRLGEDVVHAAFGEGVVTALEPDGVIVVRFAGDGSERKLMAEYAPVSRR